MLRKVRNISGRKLYRGDLIARQDVDIVLREGEEMQLEVLKIVKGKKALKKGRLVTMDDIDLEVLACDPKDVKLARAYTKILHWQFARELNQILWGDDKCPDTARVRSTDLKHTLRRFRPWRLSSIMGTVRRVAEIFW